MLAFQTSTSTRQVQSAHRNSPVLLSAAPATAGHYRAAVAIALIVLVVSIGTSRFAQLVWVSFPGFILIQQTIQAGNCLITAVLLFEQYSISRTTSLSIIAGGYLFTALMIAAHGLSFPGAFSEAGVLTGGPQSTPWFYIAWHAILPLAIIAYALNRSGQKIEETSGSAWGPIMLSTLVVMGAAAVTIFFVTERHDWLPTLVESGRLLPASRVTILALLCLPLGALLALSRRRPRTVLDLWLMVTMFASFCTIAMVSFVSAQRFDVGWYVGRVVDVLTSTFILLLLLSQTIVLYERYARERDRRLSEMEAVLIHLSRVNELGQNVSAVVHEVSQPITAISNYATAAMALVGTAPERLKPLLQQLNEQAIRAGEIVRDFRDFIAQHGSEKRIENVPEMLQGAVRLALAGAGESAPTIEMRLSPAASWAFIDRVPIEQVVFNLVRNAIEAMANGPRQVLTLVTNLTSHRMIEVSVADTGPGLSSEIHGKLFEPFVTTKATGLGIGLSISRLIIEAHGGKLEGDNTPEGGAVFRFTIPRSPVAATDADAADEKPRRVTTPV
jgi:two-component system sensor histidine kinase/response regulator